MIELPAFPLSMPHLPGDQVALRVFEERYLSMIEHLVGVETKGGSPRFATMLIERGSEVGGGDVRSQWGVAVDVVRIETGPSWSHLLGRATSTLIVREWLPENPYPRAVVELQTEEALSERERFDVASALSLVAGRALNLFDTPGDDAQMPGLRQLALIAEGRWWGDDVTDEDIWKAFWAVARALPCGPLDRYSLLGPGTLTARVRRAREVVDHVADIIEFRSKG